MGISVFLVHGTFAKNAGWTHSDSALCRTLHEKLHADITSIPWTGANTTRARQDAALKLSSGLRESLSKKPSNQHIVIGHSHGGTIALQVAARDEFRNKIGVVLLSTPILVPRKRSFSYRLGFSLAFGAYVSATTVLVILATLIGNTWPSLHASSSAVIVIPSMIAPVLGLFLLYRYLKRLTEFIVGENGLAVPDDIQLMIVRESADEASSFLGAFQLCSRLINMIFTGIEFAADSVEAWTKKAAIEHLRAGTIVPNLILMTAALGSVSFALYTFRNTFHIIVGPVTTIVILAIAVCALCFGRRAASGLASHGYFIFFGTLLGPLASLAFPIWLLLAIILFPIREAILAAPFLDVSAEATPEGKWSVNHFVPTAEVFAGWGLSHSAAYNDPRVLELIVDWTKGCSSTAQ